MVSQADMLIMLLFGKPRTGRLKLIYIRLGRRDLLRS